MIIQPTKKSPLASASKPGLMSPSDKNKLDEIDIMTGATPDVEGTSGLVPVPAAGDQDKFLKADGTWGTPTDTKYSEATTSAAGLMSADDKAKLDGIEEGANKTIVDSTLSETSKNPVQNDVTTKALNDKSDKTHKHKVSDITDFPESLPASDVSDWAKAATKPTYSASEVGADAAGSAAKALADAKTYTDGEISNILNGAPTTLDTLGEIANAMEENANVVDALDKAIGKKANTDDLTSHTNNTSNPHNVTKNQVGLGNVPNVATNDQTPTYSDATSLATLTSGEKLSIAFGKIKIAISNLISHISNKNNPHTVTKTQIGLGNVENKSSETIRSEITSENIVDALGYTPVETDAIPDLTPYAKKTEVDTKLSQKIDTVGIKHISRNPTSNGYLKFADITTSGYGNKTILLMVSTEYNSDTGGSTRGGSAIVHINIRGNGDGVSSIFSFSLLMKEKTFNTDLYYAVNDHTIEFYRYVNSGYYSQSSFKILHIGNFENAVNWSFNLKSVARIENTPLDTPIGTVVGITNGGFIEYANNAATATNASKVNNHTVNSDVPSNAKFTDTTYSNATTSAAGLMSAADKAKLDSLSGSGDEDFSKYYQPFSDLFRLM